MNFKCESTEYTALPIDQLIFSERVADMVEANGHKFPDKFLNNIEDDGTFKLNQKRLNSIMVGYNLGLPPVQVKEILGGKCIVLNGRHRVCATILNGGTIIPVNFVK